MADQQQIEFVIRPDGTVEEKVIGVVGPECEAITSGIEQALGKVVDREHTAAYYAGNETTVDDAVTPES